MRARLAVFAFLLLLPAPLRAQDDAPPVVASVEDGLRQLREVGARLAVIGVELEKIRTTPGFSEEFDAEPPPELERYLGLRQEEEALAGREEQLRAGLSDAAQSDRAGLLQALSTAQDAHALEACAAAAPAGDPDVASALLACARRVRPAPAGVRAALARTGAPAAAALLVELGVAERDGTTLRLALEAHADALGPVLDATNHAEPAVAQAARRALEDVEVGQGPDLDAVHARIERILERSPRLSVEGRALAAGLIARHARPAPWSEGEVRAELVAMVGAALRQLYTFDAPEPVRAAVALGAAALEGEVGLDLLLEIATTDAATGVRNAAVFALGRARHRAAVPALIDLLEADDTLDHAALVKALATIAGRDHGGRDVEAWRRWWSRVGER